MQQRYITFIKIRIVNENEWGRKWRRITAPVVWIFFGSGSKVHKMMIIGFNKNRSRVILEISALLGWAMFRGWEEGKWDVWTGMRIIFFVSW